MSLPEISLASAVKRQYLTGLRTIGLSFYHNLITLEVFFTFLALFAATSFGTGFAGNYIIHIRELSTAQLLWGAGGYACAMAIVLAGERYQDSAFTLVSNQLSHQLATIALIATLCLMSAVVGTLSMVLARVIAAFLGSLVLWEGFRFSPADLLLCWSAVLGYSLLAAAIVYLVSTCARRYRWLVLIIPALLALLFITQLLGLRLVMPSSIGWFNSWMALIGDALARFADSYFLESQPVRFLFKTASSAAVCFAAALYVGRRLEVRR